MIFFFTQNIFFFSFIHISLISGLSEYIGDFRPKITYKLETICLIDLLSIERLAAYKTDSYHPSLTSIFQWNRLTRHSYFDDIHLYFYPPASRGFIFIKCLKRSISFMELLLIDLGSSTTAITAVLLVWCIPISLVLST